MNRSDVRPEFATQRRGIDADAALLDAVLARQELHPKAREAFADMRERIRRYIGLTDRQRAWVQREAAQLGLSVAKPDVADIRATQAPSAWEPNSSKTFKRRSKRR